MDRKELRNSLYFDNHFVVNYDVRTKAKFDIYSVIHEW